MQSRGAGGEHYEVTMSLQGVAAKLAINLPSDAVEPNIWKAMGLWRADRE